MTPRGTDWSLALLIGLLLATGVLTLFSGGGHAAWVFALHDAAGTVLALALVWKLRRVWRRLAAPRRWDRRTVAGLLTTALVALVLASGWVWSSGGDVSLAGYNLLGWHFATGLVLCLLVALHALLRAKPLRARDVRQRRQFLQMGALAAGAYGAHRLQRPAQSLVGWRGARRRFTGSYESASFEGNAFRTTSWVTDRPRPLAPAAYRLEVAGLVDRPLALRAGELDGGDELVATLDCTGGFYSTQRWRGIRIDHLLARARPRHAATHVRVISRTGYRWDFSLADAHRLLLATRVGGKALSHEHGAPARLVAPGRRGFQWVKWVVRLELHDAPDPGALPSTVWSSLTAAGRGAA